MRISGLKFLVIGIIIMLIIVASVVFLLPFQSKEMSVSDGFENLTLSNAWSSSKFLPRDLIIQSDIVRSGNNAVKLTLHQGDQIKSEIGSNFERAELMEEFSKWSKEHSSYSYSFSLFLPEEFPLVPTRLVIAQWKQVAKINSDDSPVIALRYVNGTLMVTCMVGNERNIVYCSNEEIRSRWLDFKFVIHFSRNDDGRIVAWLDGKQIVNYSGKIGYTMREGYTPVSLYYFKMGLYRDNMREDMDIYIDEYKKCRLPNGSDDVLFETKIK
ncbi:heparin lyase I family protein [Pelosinus baikalensis]|uniref:Polysaccharide lyase n=1 Tax=Pelosinus baikalensis TaxID=2892015 RepID=A0ABS8I218_9FIRM|nr:heparin lyase I family protein [Pelosinus baikalensis]MCC5468684.1 polysaccharide lyase [Pelosinus baikalensis]